MTLARNLMLAALAVCLLIIGVQHGLTANGALNTASDIVSVLDSGQNGGPGAPPEDGPDLGPGNGYEVTCEDGAISHSGGIQGACSGHGGVE